MRWLPMSNRSIATRCHEYRHTMRGLASSSAPIAPGTRAGHTKRRPMLMGEAHVGSDRLWSGTDPPMDAEAAEPDASHGVSRRSSTSIRLRPTLSGIAAFGRGGGRASSARYVVDARLASRGGEVA